MYFNGQLRAALTSAKEGKDISREAGVGVWANYVRATCWSDTPSDVEQLDARHKALVIELDNISELSKDEKNSLRSAKCVVAKAITNNIGVWQLDDSGTTIFEDGKPMPKGKSELSATKSDFERMMGFIDAAQKKYDSDTCEPFTAEELRTLSDKYSILAYAMIESAKQQ
jgi:hypothetical protein